MIGNTHLTHFHTSEFRRLSRSVRVHHFLLGKERLPVIRNKYGLLVQYVFEKMWVGTQLRQTKTLFKFDNFSFDITHLTLPRCFWLGDARRILHGRARLLSTVLPACRRFRNRSEHLAFPVGNSYTPDPVRAAPNLPSVTIRIDDASRKARAGTHQNQKG